MRDSVSTLPAWYGSLTSDLDAADARAVALAQDLTIAQLNWRPRADTWSVGQCLEHLCLTNEVYVEPIVAALRAAPARSAGEITPGWFSRWFIRNYIEPNTQAKRARAPRKSTPVAKEIDPSILDRFIASNARVRDIMARARDYDVNRVRFRNPYMSLIRFTVGTGFVIIARHNHRHLLQAERVKAQL
jgi:hypothetical protein